MAKITGDQSTLSQALSALPAGAVELFSALNIFLSITAILGNALILTSLHKVSSIHPPTKLFFRCLAVTDLCVGLIVQPLYAINIMSNTTSSMNANIMDHVFEVRGAISWILCEVSLLTSTSISVDRILALLLGLSYRHVVTIRRARVVTICFWLISASGALILIWKRDIAFTVVSVVTILCVISSLFCYTRIHFKLRHHQVQVQENLPQGQPNGGGIPLNIAKYRRTVSSIMWVQLALVACYVPFGIVASLYLDSIEHYKTWKVVTSLVYLNSSLNPILYCFKIREVRQAVKDTIKQLYCS